VRRIPPAAPALAPAYCHLHLQHKVPQPTTPTPAAQALPCLLTRDHKVAQPPDRQRPDLAVVAAQCEQLLRPVGIPVLEYAVLSCRARKSEEWIPRDPKGARPLVSVEACSAGSKLRMNRAEQEPSQAKPSQAKPIPDQSSPTDPIHGPRAAQGPSAAQQPAPPAVNT
jgi:hypothetical protein